MLFCYFPEFNDVDDLADHYFRAAWYLSPLEKNITQISLFSSNPSPPALAVPEYLDPSLEDLAANCANITIRHGVSPDDYQKSLKDCDVLLVWKSTHLSTAKRKWPKKRIVKVDHNNEQFASSLFLKVAELFPEVIAENLKISQARFVEAVPELRFSKGYVFGTGPSLRFAMNYDFSDGLTIACNSMVKNRDLLEKLQPKIFVASDPIFHAGPSKYAAQFRRDLIWVLETYTPLLIVPMRDFHVYHSFLPEHLRCHLIGVPFIKADNIHAELPHRFGVSTTSNVLTLLLLPIAASLCETINIMGCDGRPKGESNYFWTHDPASQFNEEMDSIQTAHPAFFNISYNDYYSEHVTTLSQWIDEIEEKGVTVQNLSPSFIPCLQARSPVTLPNPTSTKYPLVSVIVPAFNAERFLPECIQSIIAQTYSNWELIIVDDGSTDRTPEIIARYAAQYGNIRTVRQTNKGVSAARNKGLSLAAGLFSTFLDADDFLPPNSIELRAQHLIRNPKFELVHGRTIFVNEDRIDLDIELGSRRIICFEDTLEGNPLHINSLMGRTSLLSATRFVESYANGEDWYYLAELLCGGLESHLCKPAVSFYRAHTSSVVAADFPKHQQNLLEVIDAITMLKKVPNERDIKALKGGIVFSLLLWKILENSAPNPQIESLESSYEEPIAELLPQRRRALFVTTIMRFFGKKESHMGKLTPEVKDRIFAGLEMHMHIPTIARFAPEIAGATQLPLEAFGRLVSKLKKSKKQLRFMVDEVGIIHKFIGNKSGVMVDVGAHFGGSLGMFIDKGWTVHAFEPDAKNRAELIADFADFPNLKINTEALGKEPQSNVPFYQSSVSTGISTLSPFHKTHEQAQSVDVTTLSAYCSAHDIHDIDFLKIDAEGTDYFVLQGNDWDKISPKVILVEYEDAKTVRLGHTVHDMADYFIARGYSVFTFCWHPIQQYGAPHAFKRFGKYGDFDIADNEWGNLVAFKNGQQATDFELFVNRWLSIQEVQMRLARISIVNIYWIHSIILRIPIPGLYRFSKFMYRSVLLRMWLRFRH